MDSLQQRDYIAQLQQKEPIREVVFRFLRERILAGQYGRGQHLTEAEVAGELGVSRTPVREALRKLEREGLVSYESRRGIRVIHMGPHEMMEIYAIMVALEGIAARLAAENGEPGEKTELLRLCTEMEAAQRSGDLASAFNLHAQFNDLIFRAGRNHRLCELLRLYQDYIDRVRSQAWSGRSDEIHAEHRAMVAAIQAGDGAAAERLTRSHVESSRQAYIKRTQAALES